MKEKEILEAKHRVKIKRFLRLNVRFYKGWRTAILDALVLDKIIDNILEEQRCNRI
jgi:hypothetical protein